MRHANQQDASMDAERWRALFAWMEEERERERAHVARTLHDDLGHRLTLAKFALHGAQTGENERLRTNRWVCCGSWVCGSIGPGSEYWPVAPSYG